MQKTLTVGSETWTFTQDAEDMTLHRLVMFKQYLIQKETGTLVPSLIKMVNEFVTGFDKNSPSKMLISMHDYLYGIQKVNEGEDFDQMLLSIILNAPDEDLQVWDKKLGKTKIKKFNSEGMKQGQVIEYVDSFLKGCPAFSEFYFQKISATMASPTPDTK